MWARFGTVALLAGWCLAGTGCQRARSESGSSPVQAPVPGLSDGAPAPSASTAAAAASDVPAAPPSPPAPECGPAGDAMIFVSPEHPARGETMRVVAVTDRIVDARLVLVGPDGKDAPATSEREGGPPYAWVAQIQPPRGGKWHFVLQRDAACDGSPIASRDVVVNAHPWAAPPQAPPRTSLWFTRATWNRSLENLYSAWIQHMFDAPADAQPSWPALHEVLRDEGRNFLFDYLGSAEDEQGMIVRPDCADLPYFLRAYFSYKLGLPFGWSHCSRGENGTPPTCTDFASQSDPFPKPDADAGADVKPPVLPAWADPDRDRDAGGPWENEVKRLGEFFRTTLADAAQSGAGRTPADDETGDYYPVALSVDTLRPGTIYADPYGHVLVLAKRVPQTATSGGVLYAVDGQPDGTVARKRFWRGNFLFAIDPSAGAAGFKRFRPIVRDRVTGKWRHLVNSELPDYSTAQWDGGVEGFYDEMDDVLSPAPLDPMQALLETIDALEEQVKTRVQSVENGRKFLASAKGVAEMPDGAHIFETTGDWEDFSTPSRDLRILIAIDVALGIPARVARRPDRYAMPSGKNAEQVRADLESRLATELASRKFSYTRTDGSTWTLSLKDVVDRAASLEVAYNPNDCVEDRWGAPAGSDELSTCQAHTPSDQLAKMQTYRAWFHDRKRPPR